MASSIIILIATAGKYTLLDRTLRSLLKCKLSPNYVGLYIVENGKKYQAESIASNYRDRLNAKYLFFQRGNKSAALNYALAQIPDDTLIWFIDDDIRVDSDILIVYNEASKGVSSGCFYGGPMFVDYEEKPPDWLIDALPASAKGWHPHGNMDYVSIPRFLGCNWAAFASDLKKAGGFNENLGPGTHPKRTGQEREMQERLLKRGVKAVYVEGAKVWHYVPKDKSSFKWLLKRRYQDGISAGIQFVAARGRLRFPFGYVKDLLLNLLKLLAYPFYPKQKKALTLINLCISAGRLRGMFIK